MKPIPSRPSDRRVQTVCLLILTLISLGVALELLRQVLVPFVLALFFAQVLSPLIDLQIIRLHFPRLIAVTMASLIGLAVLSGVGVLIGLSVGKMSDNQTQTQYEKSLQTFTNTFTSHIQNSRPARWMGVKPSVTTDKILDALQQQTIDFIKEVLSETTNVVRNGVMVVLLLFFILFGSRRQVPQRIGILAEIEARVQRYINLTLFISFLTGILVYVTLGILGVEFAALFGFLAFLLNFIPNVGAIIATLLPLPIICLNPHMALLAKVLAIGIPAAIQFGIGSVVQPKMLGDSLELHPVVLLLSLLFFTMIWGIAGAFLATPLTAVIKIVFEKIPATRALAAVLAGDLKSLGRMDNG